MSILGNVEVIKAAHLTDIPNSFGGGKSGAMQHTWQAYGIVVDLPLYRFVALSPPDIAHV